MPEARAYFLTFRTYGTWLPGDPRGAIDRRHNQYGTARMVADAAHEHAAHVRQPEASVVLSPEMRACVDRAIREVCEYRQWQLHALNVRTNHVHVVVYAPGAPPERVMNDFKAYATRALRAAGAVSERMWERHGSTRQLREADELVSTIDYVLNQQ